MKREEGIPWSDQPRLANPKLGPWDTLDALAADALAGRGRSSVPRRWRYGRRKDVIRRSRRRADSSGYPWKNGSGEDPGPRVLADVFRMMQNAAMAKDSAVTVRLPQPLKRALEARARRERRSLSAQIAAYLERGVADDSATETTPGRLLGLFEGGPVPSDEDFQRVRRLLWGSLGKRRSRRGA